jgi:hypothetical protein
MKELNESHKALLVLAFAMLIGVICIIVYAAHTEGKAGILIIVSLGILLAGASTFIGGALGFLFGIPRTLQHDWGNQYLEANLTKVDASSPTSRIDYRVNTNLEQISDWLTKILVGVSLTQVDKIRDGLISMSAFVAQAFEPQQVQSQALVLSIILYYTVLGFLFGYLWTRLFLAGALRVADQASIGIIEAKVQKATEKAENVERKIESLKKQADLDATALNLAYRQLNPSQDLPKVEQAELDSAIAAASRPIKVQIFNQAWQIRSDNWRDINRKQKMERTIPLFTALINNDVENRFHMNHGQLGFALKDKIQPDWSEAERALTTAIEIRGPWNEHGWLLYEYNRAICKIMSDNAFNQNQPSDMSLKIKILEDLRIAVHSIEINRILKSDSVIQKWLSMNGITEKDLQSI